MASTDKTRLNNSELYKMAIDYSLKHIDEGVSYTQLMTYLTDKYMPLDKDLMESFKWWYFNNYYHPETIKVVKGLSDTSFVDFDFTPYFTQKLPLSGESALGFLHEKEVQTTKQYMGVLNRNIKKLIDIQKLSLWAILAVLFFGILQLVLSMLFN